MRPVLLSLGLGVVVLAWLMFPGQPVLAPAVLETPFGGTVGREVEPQAVELDHESSSATLSAPLLADLLPDVVAAAETEPALAEEFRVPDEGPVPDELEGGLEVEPCDPNVPPPPRGTPGARQSFRTPLPPAPLWNPPGQKVVGLQAGHWRLEEAPPELRGLQHGAVGGGKQEWEVNLDIALRTQALLEAAGVHVDVLPAIVPIGYRAHAFIAIHADGDVRGVLSGFKIARPGFSSIPAIDDLLVESLYAAYQPATGLRRDDEHITNRMRFYYAFNSRRYCHSVAPGVPQAILETGFLTSAADRQLLIGNPDAPARGIASGVLAFLEQLDQMR